MVSRHLISRGKVLLLENWQVEYRVCVCVCPLDDCGPWPRRWLLRHQLTSSHFLLFVSCLLFSSSCLVSVKTRVSVHRRVNKLTTGVLFLDTLQVFEVSCVCGCVSSFPACTRHKSISLVFPAPWVRCGAGHAQRCGRFPWFEGSSQNRPAVWRTLSQGTPARKMATISSREKDVRTQEGRTSAEALVVKLYEVVNWCDEEVRKNNKHDNTRGSLIVVVVEEVV